MAFNGDWDCTADVQGQTIPFKLKLKVDGDKVTGESASDQGSLQIANGKITGDKLSYTLDIGQTITFTATVKEGKIVGQYDAGGQAGNWGCKK